MSGILEKIRSLLKRAGPVATPPGDPDRETSTNAQVEGAAGQPWPGSDDGD